MSAYALRKDLLLRKSANRPADAQLAAAADFYSGEIVGVSGMYKDAAIAIPQGEELTIGRDASKSHIIVGGGETEISGRHCGISFDIYKARYRVTDYSRNGTFKENGERLVPNMPMVIARGTVIRLAGSGNRFLLK